MGWGSQPLDLGLGQALPQGREGAGWLRAQCEGGWGMLGSWGGMGRKGWGCQALCIMGDELICFIRRPVWAAGYRGAGQ